MSNLPPPKTRKKKTEFYKALAREYIQKHTDESKSLCDICTPYMLKTDFVPDRRAIWRYVGKIRRREIS
jgi:hypothetical protein